MRSNGRQINVNLNSQNEYQRQQERLKAMAGTTDKVKSISADLMIENLLKDTSFKLPQNDRPDLQVDLPLWLRCESPTCPSEYRYLWSLVQTNMNMADTQKVSQLLLTSGLHLDVLGYIWNLANKVVPGQLTKQEFFIVLALVNLAQTGATFNNLGVLKLIPAPVIPTLHPDIIKKQFPGGMDNFESNLNLSQPQTKIYVSDSVPNTHLSSTSTSVMNNSLSAFNYNMFQANPSIKPERVDPNLGIHCKPPMQTLPQQALDTSQSNFPCIGSSPTTDLEDDFSDFQSVTPEVPETSSIVNSQPTVEEQNDEFTDFQCATVESSTRDQSSAAVPVIDPFETVVISQKREIPKIQLPKSLAGKFTNIKSNILKISPESERKLKVLSRNESLSSLPESKISSTNKVSTSISVLGSHHGIGSRLANHSLSIKPSRPKLHKHHKSKPVASCSSSDSPEDEIIFGVNTKNFESVIPKCCPKKPTTFVLKETKIMEGTAPERNSGDQNSSEEFDAAEVCPIENTRKIEIPLVGTFNETVLPTQSKSQLPGDVGTGFGVDLFSVEEDKYSALREIELIENVEKAPETSTDSVNDDFGDFLSADLPSASQEPKPISFETSENDDKDNWGDWNCGTSLNKTLDTTSADLDKKEVSIFPATNEQNFGDARKRNDTIDFLCLEEEPNAEVASLQTAQAIACAESAFLNLPLPSPGPEEQTEQTNQTNPDNTERINKNFDLPQTTPSPNLPNTANNLNSNSSENELWDLFASSTTPINNLSRHDSLQSLDFKIPSSDETEQEVIWRKCLETCQSMIQEGVEIFEGIVNAETLKEVFAAPKTTEFLNGLKIAYEITRRINQNYSEPLPVQQEVNRLWSKLEKLSLEYSINMKDDLDSMSQGSSHCKICHGYLATDEVNHGGQTFHPSCANLWVNCIDGNLPFTSQGSWLPGSSTQEELFNNRMQSQIEQL